MATMPISLLAAGPLLWQNLPASGKFSRRQGRPSGLDRRRKTCESRRRASSLGHDRCGASGRSRPPDGARAAVAQDRAMPPRAGADAAGRYEAALPYLPARARDGRGALGADDPSSRSSSTIWPRPIAAPGVSTRPRRSTSAPSRSTRRRGQEPGRSRDQPEQPGPGLPRAGPAGRGRRSCTSVR